MNCRHCGAKLPQDIDVCPECGTRQRQQAKAVRCATCHRRVQVGLHVCPYCGRTLRAAGPRWGVWLFAIAAVAVFGMWGMNRAPVARVRQRAIKLQNDFTSLVQIPQLPSPAATATRKPSQQLAALPATATVARELPTAGSTAVPPTVTAEPSQSALPAQTAESATVAPTQTPTPVPSPTATAQPTATPSPAPTGTPDTNKYYTVQMGDSLALIGEKTSMDWQAIASANNITQHTMLHPGDKLVLPAAQGGPISQPTAAAAQPATYEIRAGDSLAGIGERFGIAWEDIAKANGINAYTMLQPGMKLVLPVAGQPLPTDTPTPRPTARPTAKPLSPPSPTAVPAPRLPAPVLVSPADGTPFGGGSDTFVGLTWKPVDDLPPGAMYRLTIRYTANGLPQEQNWNIASPGMPVPVALWGVADRPSRQYSWFVTAVQISGDGKGGEQTIELSPPSPVRTFTWQ